MISPTKMRRAMPFQKPAQVCKSLHKYTRACTSIQEPAQVSKSLHKYAKARTSMPKHAKVFKSIFKAKANLMISFSCLFSNFMMTFSRLFSNLKRLFKKKVHKGTQKNVKSHKST